MDSGAPLSFDAVPVPTPPGARWRWNSSRPRTRGTSPGGSPTCHISSSSTPPNSTPNAGVTRMSRPTQRYGPTDDALYGMMSPDQPFARRERLDDELHRDCPMLEGLAAVSGRIGRIVRLRDEHGCSNASPAESLRRVPVVHVSRWSVYDWVISFDHPRPGVDRGSSVTGFAGRRHAAEEERHVQAEHVYCGTALAVLRAPRGPDAQRGALSRSARTRSVPQYPLPGFPGVTSNFDRDGYEAAVRRAVEYVHAGDCFQVNLSQRLLAPLREHPLDLYGRLRATQPGPVRRVLRPRRLPDPQRLAGTVLAGLPRRRGRDAADQGHPAARRDTPEEDAALVRDLATSPKDRAENVMIVDLLRNDLGRVCEYGSVRVPRVCEVETFRYVHHLVSEVRGKLRPGLGPLDLLAAAFPGGSVTGAPKVRAMEIIAELEPTARGPYCGCLGYVGFDGAMDTNILIRTFTAGRGWVQFPVGGGIVADTDPAREYEETLHKAAGLLRALVR